MPVRKPRFRPPAPGAPPPAGRPLRPAAPPPPPAAYSARAWRPEEAAGRGEEPLDLLSPQPIPEDADAPARRREALQMRTLVEHALQKMKLPNQELWREEIEQVWARAIPPELAPVLRPGKWERGVLYLYVTSSMRLFEIQRKNLREIESRLRQQFGPERLKQVRLLLDPDGGDARPG